MPLLNMRYVVILNVFILLDVHPTQGLKPIPMLLLFLDVLLWLRWVVGIFSLFFAVLNLSKPFATLLFFLPLLILHCHRFEGWEIPT